METVIIRLFVRTLPLPRISDTGRIILNEAGKQALNEMLSKLTSGSECVKTTPSKVASWILAHYLNTAFEGERGLIAQAHFDSKEYLKRAIGAASTQEDLAEALETALQRMKIQPPGEPVKRGRRKQKTPVQDEDGETVMPEPTAELKGAFTAQAG